MLQSSLVKGVLWNGFLAVLPVVLAYVTLWTSRIRANKPVRYASLAVLSLVWLAFLPNTCYLLTEWRHFLLYLDINDFYVRSHEDPMLFLRLCEMSLFYLLYSGFGMVTFALAIRPMEHLAARKGASIWFWAVPFFVALSLGVYLGLILRFNSWDILSRPSVIWDALLVIGGRPRLLAFIFAFGIFLWIAYEAIDVWIDGLAERWSRLAGRRIHLGPDMKEATG